MSFSEPGPTAVRRRRSSVRAAAVVVGAALVGILVYQSLTPSSFSATSPLDVLLGDQHAARGAADGLLPDGVTVFDDEHPAVTNLDPALLAALRQAATDAADDGVEIYVNSGWRSAEYQQQLLARRGLGVRLGGGGRPMGSHSEDVSSRVRRRGRRRETPLPRCGCPSAAPGTGCARSTATSRGTSSCAPRPSSGAALGCTSTLRTTRGCSHDRRGPPHLHGGRREVGARVAGLRHGPHPPLPDLDHVESATRGSERLVVRHQGDA